MIHIDNYIQQFSSIFPKQKNLEPWIVTTNLSEILNEFIQQLDQNYEIKDGNAIHKSAVVEKGVTLKPPVIISENCFIGAHAYLRGGVFLGKSSSIGPSCEVKTSIILQNSSIAHFNFVGDSIIGSHVNFESGSLAANHYNERVIKNILVLIDSETVNTETGKFGSLIGDHSKIGANAVLSPGTILKSGSIVKRLELIEQIK